MKFIQGGGSKAEAVRCFAMGRRTVYCYLAAAQAGLLAPKTSWGQWRTLDPEKLSGHVKKHPAATLQKLVAVFGVSHNAVWVRLRKLGFTLKKLMKYRERSEVQRWRFRRELEKFRGWPVFFSWTRAAWITACIVSLAAPPGGADLRGHGGQTTGTPQRHGCLPARQAGRAAGLSRQLPQGIRAY